MSRRAWIFATSCFLAALVGIFGDGDWWVMFLAGWGVSDVVFTFWPSASVTEERTGRPGI